MDEETRLSEQAVALLARLHEIEAAQDPNARSIDYDPLDGVINAVQDALFVGEMTEHEADVLTREAGPPSPACGHACDPSGTARHKVVLAQFPLFTDSPNWAQTKVFGGTR